MYHLPTFQTALREIKLGGRGDRADVARQREALVVEEFDLAPVRLEHSDRERQLTWQTRASVARSGALIPPMADFRLKL